MDLHFCLSLKFYEILKKNTFIVYIHCSKHLRDRTFKAIYLEFLGEKSFQIVVLFSRITVLDNAVVAGKK